MVIKTEVRQLGVVRADPADYVARYGSSLQAACDLPRFVHAIATPAALGPLACQLADRDRVPQLEGDVHALAHCDLEREGLAEYGAQLQRHLLTRASTHSSTG